MLESLIVTLREGVETALVVAIIVGFLRREGLDRHLRAVWLGLAAAVAASFLGAWSLRSWAVNEEAFEGVLYLGSAVVVGSMLAWMWRNGRRVAQGMKSSLGEIVQRRSAGGVFWGLFLFTFLMVFREGVETVLFLTAVSLTTSGVLAATGALAGLALAVWVGVLFFRGSLRIDLGRFLKVTAIALGIFVVQLVINGYHELAEAHWLPATPRSMALIGPLVRYDVFFIAAIVALPLLALVVPGPDPTPAAAPLAANPAEARLRRHQDRRQRHSRLLAGAVGLGVMSLLGMSFAYSQQPQQLSPAEPVALSAGAVRIPLARIAGGGLHRFTAEVDGRQARFIALEIAPGEVVAAFDACVICGPRGYYQAGSEVVCMHCSSAIYPPSIGQPGGCNPVPLEFRVEGDDLVIAAASLAPGTALFTPTSPHH
ncbi:MAG TPA: Fe-S-containing protein [Thermoanaerobaculia bacterium]|nr:Fe-S-containing protein [Thermoanaerobaculia bacterium]